MRGILFLVLSIFLMLAVLVGCQPEGSVIIDADANNTNNQQQSEDNLKSNLDGEITYINISRTMGNSVTVFDDASSIESLKSIISSAMKENGIVNMITPELNMQVVYENENKQIFHLWIAEKGGNSTLMNTDDTHTIYTISEEMTNKLIELIE